MMKISCIQMDMAFCQPDINYAKAENLIRKAVKEENCDTVILPETWNTGFFPKENLYGLSDKNGEKTIRIFSALAIELNINIIAGSVSNVKNNKVYNTCYVFNKQGECVCEYDKTHSFTPMNEHKFYEKGNNFVTFELDGYKCSVVICYDIRFPELTRTLTTQNKLDYLFVVSQWPCVRIPHLEVLTRARAIENQMFCVVCNSCGKAGDTVYGGASVIYDPWGEILAKASDKEEIITAECDESVLDEIRKSINVFADRRTDIYRIN